MTKTPLLVGFIGTLVACGAGSADVNCVDASEMTTVKAFSAQYADVICEVRGSCDPVQFEKDFEEGMDACKRVMVNQETKHGTTQVCERDCAFDTEAADLCVLAVEDVACAEWSAGSLEQACTQALWECPES
jgi:hypothetical protein